MSDSLIVRLIARAVRYFFHGGDELDPATVRRIRAADSRARSAREQEEMPRGRRAAEPVTTPEPAAEPEITSEYTKETPR